MFSAMGTEARLRIMQLLMTAEPKGMIVGDIQSEIDIPNSTLSHHLDKLKNENLVTVRRDGTYLWYRASKLSSVSSTPSAARAIMWLRQKT